MSNVKFSSEDLSKRKIVNFCLLISGMSLCLGLLMTFFHDNNIILALSREFTSVNTAISRRESMKVILPLFAEMSIFLFLLRMSLNWRKFLTKLGEARKDYNWQGSLFANMDMVMVMQLNSSILAFISIVCVVAQANRVSGLNY